MECGTVVVRIRFYLSALANNSMLMFFFSNPGQDGLPPWNEYKKENRQHVEFHNHSTIVSLVMPHDSNCDFWNAISDKMNDNK